MKISEVIIKKIENVGRGHYFTADDFIGIASPETIRQNLSRLAKSGLLLRITNGFFYYPEKIKGTDLDMPVFPTTHIYEFAKRNKFEVMYLDTSLFELLEVEDPYPDEMVFITNGKSRVIKFEDIYEVRLVKTINMNYFKYRYERIGGLVYIASRIGKDNLTEKQKATIKEHFYSINRSRVISDIQHVPAWFKEIVW